MHKSLYILVISLITFNCLAQKTSSKSRKSINTDSLRTALNSFAKNSLIPGFSVAIVDQKGLVYTEGFGYANVKLKKPFTPNTIHWVASISKTFLAFSIMKLADEGKLNLDEPINSILPYKIINPYFPNNPITVRHLVTHTSTITDFFEPYTVGEADVCLTETVDTKNYPEYLQPNIDYYKRGKPISLDENIRKYTQPNEKWYNDSTFLKKEPGTYYQYTNLGASIAARIVEIKSGMSFISFTKKYIFNPLKMKNTGWNFEDLNPKLVSKIYAYNTELNPTGVVEHPQYYMTNYPVSGLKTTALDMSKYIAEMILGLEGRSKLLSVASYKEIFKPQLPLNMVQTEDPIGKINNMGIFWFLSNNSISHIGGNNGIYSFIYINPTTKRGAFAHTNLRDNGFGEILEIVKLYEQKMIK